jgi:AhpD family alkylhydroperoxidase
LLTTLSTPCVNVHRVTIFKIFRCRRLIETNEQQNGRVRRQKRRWQCNPDWTPEDFPPEGYRAVYALEQYVHHSGLELKLLELVRLRASLLNGCAYCVDMHTKDARAEGETEQRLFAVPVWRETPFFTDRERAALAWTEAVTLVGKDHVPDDVFAAARSQFSEKELVDLTLAIVAINNWNRLAISFRAVPGSYHRPAEMKTGTR